MVGGCIGRGSWTRNALIVVGNGTDEKISGNLRFCSNEIVIIVCHTRSFESYRHNA